MDSHSIKRQGLGRCLFRRLSKFPSNPQFLPLPSIFFMSFQQFRPQVPLPSSLPSVSLLFQTPSRRMKQMVQQLRFKQKMEAINRKKGKYKRSTNNCHKKYIGILKNLLFLKLSPHKKGHILSQYSQYKNSRVYYFIILAHLKWLLDSSDIRWIFQHFCQQVQGKINRYKLQISTTNNANFIHFRKDQIIEMEYSIQSINYFLRGDAEESIRMLYQKNKFIIVKRNQYLRTVDIVRNLQEELQREAQERNIEGKMERLKLGEIYRWNKQMSFNQLETIERVSKRRSRELEDGQDSGSEESEEEQSERLQQYWAKSQKERPQVTPLPVPHPHHYPQEIKQQAQSPSQSIKYPLLQLQNSYRVGGQLEWHSWIIQKQKMIEFHFRNREDQLKRNGNSGQNMSFSRVTL